MSDEIDEDLVSRCKRVREEMTALSEPPDDDVIAYIQDMLEPLLPIQPIPEIDAEIEKILEHRIKYVTERLRQIWLRCPYLRLGQLILSIPASEREIFYTQDEELIEALEHLFPQLEDEGDE